MMLKSDQMLKKNDTYINREQDKKDQGCMEEGVL